MYLHEGTLDVKLMGRGYAWLDTGTHGSLLDAGNFVRTLENRQGQQTGSPDEIAYVKGWIDAGCLGARAALFGKNSYGAYLQRLLEDPAIAAPAKENGHARSSNGKAQPGGDIAPSPLSSTRPGR